MGSVKNLITEKEPTEDRSGIAVFEFTDDYSVFDFGKMPDVIQGKGESLCRMAAYNFKQLEEMEIETHFRELVASNKMRINLVRVINPKKQKIFEETRNYLVPLEVIYRNSLPKGSSVFKRLSKGQITLDELGLEQEPIPGQKLERPFLDVSTKLDETDTYLSWEQARVLSGLSEDQIIDLRNIALQVNAFLNEKAESLGWEHADGKMEFALSPKNHLIVADVFGTIDEDRFLFQGIHLSKQVLRDYYLKTPWAKQIEEAKEKALPKESWPKPERIPEELLHIAENMYKAGCEAWIERKIWNAPSIEEVINQYKSFLEKTASEG